MTSLEAAMSDMNKNDNRKVERYINKSKTISKIYNNTAWNSKQNRMGFILHLQERFAKRLSRILGEQVDETTLS